MHIYSREEDATFNGFYIPSVFYMEINTTDPLKDLNDLSDKDKSTFFHEYVHFLQDITTTFGLTNIVCTVELQKAMNKVVIDSDDPMPFSTPVNIGRFKSTLKYSELNSMFFGDPLSDFNEKSIITGIKPYPNKAVTEHEDKEMILVAYTNAGEPSDFQLGAIQIMESMAHIVQRNLYEVESAPHYPYSVVERVVEHLYPALKFTDVILVTLSDYALMAPDPGRFLYQLLDVLKKHKVTSEEGMYNVLRDYTFVGENGEEQSVFRLFEQRYELAVKLLPEYFTVDTFDGIREWIKDVLEAAVTIKQEKMHFWKEMLSLPTREERIGYLSSLSGKLGFPLVSNTIGDVVFYHPNHYPKYLLNLKAIEEVANIMLGSKAPCRMMAVCKKGEEGDHTNADCGQPWKRGTQDPLCPFGQIIKMWGLHEKLPEGY